MSEPPSQRSHGAVFNRVAAEYLRSRPAYPEELVERACELAGLRRGDHVLEIGCGKGRSKCLQIRRIPGRRWRRLTDCSFSWVGRGENSKSQEKRGREG